MLRYFFLCCICCISMVLCCSVPEAAGADRQPVLRVGWYLVDGLHNIDQAAGQYSGYDYDYLRSIAQFNGWQYEFVAESLADCLADLANGRLDIVGGVARTPEREAQFAYTRNSAGRAAPRLVAKQEDDRYSFADFSSFQGMRIGVLDSANLRRSLEEYAEEHQFSYELFIYKSQEVLQNALADGAVDALFISGTRNIQGLRVLAQLPPQEFYFITRMDELWIRDGLDQGISMLNFFDRNYENSLYQKYFSASYTPAVSFSVAEREYLDEKIRRGEEIIVAYDPEWRPVEYRDPVTGEFSGVMRDVFDRISQRTGLKFHFVTADNFSDALQQYKDTVAVFSTLGYDFSWGDEHEAWLTQPIFEMQLFQVYTNDQTVYDKIALPRGTLLSHLVEERIRKEGKASETSFIYYDTTMECIDAVRSARAGYTFVNEYELNYYMEKFRLEHLNVQSVTGFTEKAGIGVSKHTDPRLLSILCRTLESISGAEMNSAILSNTRNRLEPGILDRIYAHPLQALLLFGAGLFFPVLSIFFYYASRRDRRQRAALQAASNAKSEFLSRISHDIRTPMNAILGMTELARRANTSPKIADYLTKINHSSTFLLELINDILDMSAIENGEVRLHPEAYSVQEFRLLLKSSIAPLADQKHIRLYWSVDESLHCIFVDKLRFNQIFLNLLANAVKFTPAGGEVRFSLNKLVEKSGIICLRVAVSDTGKGIQPEFLPDIFKPFTQEERHIDAAEGTGLGLAIVKRLVDALQGSLSVQSEVGRGTEFLVTLTLPACTCVEKELAGKEEMTISLVGRRVLVVEDNEINQEVVCALLEQAGVQCETAENGRIAIDKINAASSGWFEAIFMDIRMPVMDGLEATRQIRSLPREDAKTVPIIALTADAYLDEQERIMECGMTEYLAKPVQPDQLIETLEKVLRNK